MNSTGLLSLLVELVLLVTEHLNNIEDFMNISSTCTQLRSCMARTTPNVILRLAAAQTKVFFRPSPHFLVTATARELGNWARKSDANEEELALKLEEGTDGLLELAAEHCGLTMERIRELHSLRSSLINPVTDSSFWATEYIIECFGPDPIRDPRLDIKPTGPYMLTPSGSPSLSRNTHNHHLALTWLIRSSRFRPLYKDHRAKAGVPDFQKNFNDGWWFADGINQDWRQRLWECIMVCQGLEGLGMLMPDTQLQWLSKIREWKDKIANLDREPPLVKVGRQATLEYPYLLGDLRVCARRFVRRRLY